MKQNKDWTFTDDQTVKHTEGHQLKLVSGSWNCPFEFKPIILGSLSPIETSRLIRQGLDFAAELTRPRNAVRPPNLWMDDPKPSKSRQSAVSAGNFNSYNDYSSKSYGDKHYKDKMPSYADEQSPVKKAKQPTIITKKVKKPTDAVIDSDNGNNAEASDAKKERSRLSLKKNSTQAVL